MSGSPRAYSDLLYRAGSGWRTVSAAPSVVLPRACAQASSTVPPGQRAGTRAGEPRTVAAWFHTDGSGTVDGPLSVLVLPVRSGAVPARGRPATGLGPAGDRPGGPGDRPGRPGRGERAHARRPGGARAPARGDGDGPRGPAVPGGGTRPARIRCRGDVHRPAWPATGRGPGAGPGRAAAGPVRPGAGTGDRGHAGDGGPGRGVPADDRFRARGSGSRPGTGRAVDRGRRPRRLVGPDGDEAGLHWSVSNGVHARIEPRGDGTGTDEAAALARTLRGVGPQDPAVAGVWDPGNEQPGNRRAPTGPDGTATPWSTAAPPTVSAGPPAAPVRAGSACRPVPGTPGRCAATSSGTWTAG